MSTDNDQGSPCEGTSITDLDSTATLPAQEVESSLQRQMLQLQELINSVMAKITDGSSKVANQNENDSSLAAHEELLSAKRIISDLSKQNAEIQKKRENVNPISQAKKNIKQKYKKTYRTELMESLTNKFLIATFNDEMKRKVNIFTFIKDIKNLTGQEPKRIFSSGKNALTIEVTDEKQAAEIVKIKSAEGIACTIKEHPSFNNSVGIIYVNDFDISDLDEFKAGLMEKYGVVNVEKATFIKPKEPTTQAFLLSFKQQYLPYSIYIPGERQDTKVYPFKNKPMMCKSCQDYGHTAKRCKKTEKICRRCAVQGHSVDDCEAQKPKCHHCSEEHAAGHRFCGREIKQRKIVEIQQKEKVSFRRAHQILNSESTIIETPKEKFITHFDCSMGSDNKRKMSPWTLEKCIAVHLGSKPAAIRSSKNAFTVVVRDRHQSMKMKSLTTINDLPVTVTQNLTYGTQKGLIFVYEYDMSNFENYKLGLLDRCGVQDAVVADWIKVKNPLATPMVVTFRGPTLPEYIAIPGEQAMTKVLEMKQKPLMCKKCLEYGHGVKFCQGEERCAHCGEEGHQVENCSAEGPTCFHCSSNHIAGAKECRVRRTEEEILAIQSKERVSRPQARMILHDRNPSHGMNYSQAVTAQPKPTTSATAPLEKDDRNLINDEKKRSRQSDSEAEQQEDAPATSKQRTEVVCQNLEDGGLFTTFIDLSPNKKKKKGKRKETVEDEKDRSLYEEQLRNSKKHQKQSTSSSPNSSGEQHSSSQNKGRKSRGKKQTRWV